jgi:hypothetical protein
MPIFFHSNPFENQMGKEKGIYDDEKGQIPPVPSHSLSLISITIGKTQKQSTLSVCVFP